LTLTDDHYLIVLGSSYGNVIDGFKIAYSDVDSHSTSSNSAFVRCLGRFALLKILQVDYQQDTNINTDDYASVDIEESGGILQYGVTGKGYITNEKMNNPKGVTPCTGTHKLFTVSDDYYSVWLITSSWSYLNSSCLNTWIASGCNTNNLYTGIITVLQSGGDRAANTTLAIHGKDIEMIHTTNLNTRWTATRLDIGNRI
jgi:hypothetical protein